MRVLSGRRSRVDDLRRDRLFPDGGRAGKLPPEDRLGRPHRHRFRGSGRSPGSLPATSARSRRSGTRKGRAPARMAPRTTPTSCVTSDSDPPAPPANQVTEVPHRHVNGGSGCPPAPSRSPSFPSRRPGPHTRSAERYGAALLALVVALSLQVGVNSANGYSDGIGGTGSPAPGGSGRYGWWARTSPTRPTSGWRRSWRSSSRGSGGSPRRAARGVGDAADRGVVVVAAWSTRAGGGRTATAGS